MTATTFIGHFLGPDTHTNRPAATGLPNGTLYVCTTHQKIERVVSGAWADYATLGGGGMTKIFDSTLAVAAASIDTGAGGIPAGYSALQVVGHLRGATGTGGVANATVRVNNDSTNVYYTNYLRVTGGSTVAGNQLGSTSGWVVTQAASDAIANAFGVFEMTIPSYDGPSYKKVATWQHGCHDGGTSYQHYTASGLFDQTGAITRLAVFGAGAVNLAIGSRLIVYGLP